MTDHPATRPNSVKFAYWVPNVSGGLVISKIEQRTSWDVDYNRKLAQIAEQSGFWYFTNGNTPDEIRKQVEDIRAKASAEGRHVKVGVNAFIIARDTEDEARAVLDEIIAEADPDAVNAFGHEVKNAGQGFAGRAGQLGEVELQRSRPVQRWFPLEPDRHAAADRRTHRRAQGGGALI